MKNPIDLGHKTVDAARITAIKPISDEQRQSVSATLSSSANWTAEARSLGGPGGYIADLGVEKVVAGLARHGEKLAFIPESGEAVRRDWLTSVKPFASRADRPSDQRKFRSVATFVNPETGETSEEWFAATPEQLRGGKVPSIHDLAGGPG